MVFLGKIALESGGRRLAVTPEGEVAMLALGPSDPMGIFLAYDLGGGWFALQCYLGTWLQFAASQSPIAWHPVLHSARAVPYRDGFTRFALRFFDSASHQVSLAFLSEDSVDVALLSIGEINPYCQCRFDVSASWSTATTFALKILAPGVGELNRTKCGTGCDFGSVGRANVDFGGVAFGWVNFQEASFTGANLGKAVFTSCNLARARLAGASLTGASFPGCTLARAWLAGARLAGADFARAAIAGADFSGCNLTEGTRFPPPPLSTSPLERTVLRNARVPAALLGKDWSCLDLTGAEIGGLDKADLRGLAARDTVAPLLNLVGRALRDADFSNSDLGGARFEGADLSGARFHSARLANATFTQAQLARADFAPDPTRPGSPATNLEGARFNRANLTGASFRQASMTGALFVAANMGEVDLTSALLGARDPRAAANLSYAYLEDARLDGATLAGVNFSSATFFGERASLHDTVTMERVDFTNAWLAGIDFSRSNLRGARFTGACLVGARLNEVDLQRSDAEGPSGPLQRASLAGAMLPGAAFRGAKLDWADLSNAAVAIVAGGVPVRRCNAEKRPEPAPPATRQLLYQPTSDLDLNTLGKETICPNGFTVRENQAAGRSLPEMLTSANAPATWFPSGCGPSRRELPESRRTDERACAAAPSAERSRE